MTLEDDFMWIAGSAFSEMRLMVEGAITLFEDGILFLHPRSFRHAICIAVCYARRGLHTLQYLHIAHAHTDIQPVESLLQLHLLLFRPFSKQKTRKKGRYDPSDVKYHWASLLSLLHRYSHDYYISKEE